MNGLIWFAMYLASGVLVAAVYSIIRTWQKGRANLIWDDKAGVWRERTDEDPRVWGTPRG